MPITALSPLLQRRDIWQATRCPMGSGRALSSGWSALDEVLPGRGWEFGSVTELVNVHAGQGELTLLLPALARLTQEGRVIALIAPPFLPYAPAWQNAGVVLSQLVWISDVHERERLWATEQSLREPACACVLSWFERALPEKTARRLQVAAGAGGNLGFLMQAQSQDSSPFPLRLSLQMGADAVVVSIRKRRGPPLLSPISLPISPNAAPHSFVVNNPAIATHHALASSSLPRVAARRASPREPLVHA